MADGWVLRPCAAEGPDVELVAGWMAQPHVAAFWHQHWPLARWRQEIAGQQAGSHSRPLLAERDGRPIAYLEIYRVVLDRLAACYPAHEADVGVHLAIGDGALTGRGLGRSLLRAVADDALAADPACRRVVAEPDAGNAQSVRAFLAAGFRHRGLVTLPDKTAALLVRPRREQDLP